MGQVPMVLAQVFEMISAIEGQGGVTILLVEQNARMLSRSPIAATSWKMVGSYLVVAAATLSTTTACGAPILAVSCSALFSEDWYRVAFLSTRQRLAAVSDTGQP